jgi:hypothetical protein
MPFRSDRNVKVRFGPGLSISIGGDGPTMGGENEPARPACDQTNPRAVYVYGHFDPNGSVFYVGKGSGRRAWSRERHDLWVRHVKKLGGRYEVRILADGLSDGGAEEYEGQLITQHGKTLVNWQNFGRSFDLKAIERYNALKDANQAAIAETRKLEKTDIEIAIANYQTAIEKIAGYASIELESDSLVAELLRDECDELGRRGEVLALERLTMCLLKLGRATEAARASDEYFLRYRRDLETAIGKRTKARIEKAETRLSGF